MRSRRASRWKLPERFPGFTCCDPERVVFARQNPEAIERGAFHNDLIAVGNGRVLIVHAAAFREQESTLKAIGNGFVRSTGEPIYLIEVSAAEVSLADALESYLFNSQVVTLPDGSMCLVAPWECCQIESVYTWIQRLLAGDNPVRRVEYVDLRESMRNGGGPACLRLRVVLNPSQQTSMHPAIMMTSERLARLEVWVERRYRDRLRLDDLTDPGFVDETRAALDELTQILDLGPLYPFQRE